MNRTKKLLSVLTISLLLTSLTNVSFAASTEKLDYKSALDLSVSSSENLKVQDSKIKTAQDRYYNYCNFAVDAKYKVGNSDVEQIEYRKQELLYPLQKFNALTYLKYDKDAAIKNLKLDLTDKYFSFLIINKEIELQSKVIENTKKELEIATSKLKAGKLTNTSFESIQSSLSEENFNLEQLRRSRLNAEMALNYLIGNELEKDINIAEVDVPKADYSISIDAQQLDKLISNYQNTDINVKKAKNDLEEANIELKIINDNTNNKNYTGKEALEDTVTNSTYKVNSALATVESTIRKEYNNLLNLNDDVSISSIKYEMAKKDVELGQKKYELGLTDYSSILNQIVQRDNAEIALLKAKLSFYIQSLKFSDYMIK